MGLLQFVRRFKRNRQAGKTGSLSKMAMIKAVVDAHNSMLEQVLKKDSVKGLHALTDESFRRRSITSLNQAWLCIFSCLWNELR